MYQILALTHINVPPFTGGKQRDFAGIFLYLTQLHNAALLRDPFKFYSNGTWPKTHGKIRVDSNGNFRGGGNHAGDV